MFNVDALVNAPADTMATTIPTCPEGEYTAVIDTLPAEGIGAWLRTLEGRDGKPDRLMLNVPFVILDDGVKQTLGRDKVTVPQTVWLDIGPDGSTLLTGEGKNVTLGRLREALGQNNQPGWTMMALAGAGPVRVVVGHRADRNDPSVKYAEVRRVSAL